MLSRLLYVCCCVALHPRLGRQAAALGELAATDERLRAALGSAASAEGLLELDACLEVGLVLELFCAGSCHLQAWAGLMMSCARQFALL